MMKGNLGTQMVKTSPSKVRVQKAAPKAVNMNKKTVGKSFVSEVSLRGNSTRTTPAKKLNPGTPAVAKRSVTKTHQMSKMNKHNIPVGKKKSVSLTYGKK